MVRRFDEFVGEEMVSTYFTHDAYIDKQIERTWGEKVLHIADDEFASDNLVSVIESEPWQQVIISDERPLLSAIDHMGGLIHI